MCCGGNLLPPQHSLDKKMQLKPKNNNQLWYQLRDQLNAQLWDQLQSEVENAAKTTK